MWADCQAARGHGAGPSPVMTRAQLRESLDLLQNWVLARKAAANSQVIAIMRQRLAAGEAVARMYQEPGLAWLEGQAEAAEQLLAEEEVADDRERRPPSGAPGRSTPGRGGTVRRSLGDRNLWHALSSGSWW